MQRQNLIRRKIQRLTQSGPIDRGTALNTVQAPHISNRIMRATGIREMAPVPELSRELVPVIIVDDVSRDAARDDAEAYWIARIAVTAAAGEFPVIGLRNRTGPTGTDAMDLVIESFWVNAAASSEFHYLRSGVLAGATQTTPTILESRSRADAGSGDVSTAAECHSGDLVAVVPGFTIRGGGSGVECRATDLNFTIPPGLFFYVEGTIAAGALDVTLFWHEIRRRQ